MSCQSNTYSSNRRTCSRDEVQESTRIIRPIEVVKGYGTLESIGVQSSGTTAIPTVEQVDFKIHIYKVQGKYEGEIYLVNYDSRKKYSSNKLRFFVGNDNSCLCVFGMKTDDGVCCYEMVVEASPLVCTRGTGPLLYAYSAPINTLGINIGGEVVRGEIIFCEEQCCCKH